MIAADFESLSAAHGLSRAKQAALTRAAVPALRLVKSEGGDPGHSHFGGYPDPVVGPDEWPSRDGRPLTFLAQIDCAAARLVLESANAPALGLVPPDGILQFYFALSEQPWGFRPSDATGSRVIHVRPEFGSSAVQGRAISQASRPAALPEIPLTFRVDMTYPSPRSSALEQLALGPEDESAYWDVFDEMEDLKPGPAHQLLGHASNIQGPMEIEAQLVSQGIDLGSNFDDDIENSALANGVASWKLLLQLDSDDDLGLQFGDAGRLYFWVREVLSKEPIDSRTWAILQCH